MRNLSLAVALTLAACSAADYRADADREVYGILGRAATVVTGDAKTFPVERAVETLRSRLLSSPTEVQLDLHAALDAAAENSRDFQRQKEQLYTAALGLTRERWNFSTRYSGGGGASVSGTGDDDATLRLSDDLAATTDSESGGRLVASFVNTFLKDIVSGGNFVSSSVLGLAFTQPLLRGAGRRIAREPLTQAERDVIYAMRSFERFRAEFAVRVVSEYYSVLQQIDNLDSERANLDGTKRNRERVEAQVEAGRLAGVDLDRARQQEYSAEDRLNDARARLESALDRFKLTLGLPTEAAVQLDLAELSRLRQLEVVETILDEPRALDLALGRRYDHRNAVDNVEDAARQILVTEDALNSVLDFSAAVSVPTEPGKPFKFDWAKVGWSAGFNLDLAIDQLPERNAYRAALINLDAAIRNRELSDDTVKNQVRAALRSLRREFNSHKIQSDALRLSERRLERANDFLQAGLGDTLTLLDAQEDLLLSRLALTGAIVGYAIARLELLRDLEGLALEPKGLRYDPALPIPAESARPAPTAGVEQTVPPSGGGDRH